MGRATRWLKALFGLKNDTNKDTTTTNACTRAGLCHNPTTIPPNMSPTEAAWIRSYCHNEQSKHATEVASATASAAMVAAQATAAVVKLTSNSNKGKITLENWKERYAAVRIQSLFRGYLARKALRALKALVKLQAVVRGFLVRKQTVATLRSMHALIRAQATVRSHRIRSLRINNSRKALENLDTRSVHSRRLSSTFETIIDDTPGIVEMDTGSRPRSRYGHGNISISKSLHDHYSTHILLSPYPYTQDSGWGFTSDECKFSTAQSTPRLCAKSAVNPSYMGNTKSFRAKVRSQSAPRQRRDAGRVSLVEMMEARSSLSGVKMQRSCSNAQDVVSFKNAVMGKLEMGEMRRPNACYYNNVSRR